MRVIDKELGEDNKAYRFSLVVGVERNIQASCASVLEVRASINHETVAQETSGWLMQCSMVLAQEECFHRLPH